MQYPVGHEKDEKRNEQCSRESREPGEARELLFFRMRVRMGGCRFLTGLVDDVARIQEHRGLEQSVGDEMEDGQREGAQSAFHDHVTHLADRREAERVLDVVLDQHHGRAEDRCERPDHQSNMQRGRAHTEERGQAIDEKPAGIDDPGVQQRRRRGRRIEIAREPDEHGKLRRLTHGADEQEQCDHGRPADLDAGPRR
ncbi:MAG: hypothetical protein JW395_3540 [Nitrospira sp.]|nr:hypothetical protein [Nitrospira sp.]